MPLDPLPPEALAWICDPASLGFTTSDELADHDGPVGQERAAEAIRTGLRLRRDGYHIAVVGPDGIGRHRLALDLVRAHAKGGPPGSDWLYLPEPEAPEKLRLLRLPAGRGRSFLADVDALRADPSALDRLVGSWEEAPARRYLEGLRGVPVLDGRLRPRLLVEHAADAGAPVVYEPDPSHDRLFGRFEPRLEQGSILADATSLRAGALHRAHGGYLLLDLRRLLSRQPVWEALKRVLRTRSLRVGPAARLASLPTGMLDTEPMPLDLKLVLLGDRQLFNLLQQGDPDLGRLVKIVADLEDRPPRTPEATRSLAAALATLGRQEGLLPLAADGMARMIEQAQRLAGGRDRISVDLAGLGDLLAEADLAARDAGATAIDRGAVEAALAARERRLERAALGIRESTLEGQLQIATSGAVVGQVNGLSVFFQPGGVGFGRPMRITARVRMGGPQVMDIERESRLGGMLHAKGVLTLIGYLQGRYAFDVPAALQATLVFEQSYGPIDGDSASSAELYALLSAIAELPVAQGLAITGAVSQMGEVQVIGGVNEKIEGFFDLCAARGLDGSQGVLIPTANIRHLMLHARVRDAVRAGRFRIHAVAGVDEGMALLTGLPAGERGPDGAFPEGSVNRRIEDNLRRLAIRRRAFGQAKGDGRRPPPPPAATPEPPAPPSEPTEPEEPAP